jgi:hypothetical protein
LGGLTGGPFLRRTGSGPDFQKNQPSGGNEQNEHEGKKYPVAIPDDTIAEMKKRRDAPGKSGSGNSVDAQQ